MEKRLYRSKTNKMIAGVCGGIAEYFQIDPTVVRLIAVLSIFLNGFGILAYIILMIVVPSQSSMATQPREAIRENVEEMKDSATRLGEDLRTSFPPGRSEAMEVPQARSRAISILGLVLIVFGAVFLAGSVFNISSWFNWSVLWPLILVAIGVLIIVGGKRR